MRSFSKIVFTSFSIFILVAGVTISFYEIYNSFIAEEPKNIMTYHAATSRDAEAQKHIVATPEDAISTPEDAEEFELEEENSVDTTILQAEDEVDADTDELIDGENDEQE